MRNPDELGPRGRAKRDQIVAAARELFLDHGFEGTSMEALRLRAGVSKPTLYGHFESKDQLFAAVLTGLVDEIAGDWVGDLDQDAPATVDELAERLRTFVHRAAAGLARREYLTLLRTVVGESARLPELGVIFVEVGPRRAAAEISRLLSGARERGLVHIDDVDAAARLLVDTLFSQALDEVLLAPGPTGRPSFHRIDSALSLLLTAVNPAATTAKENS